MESCVPALVGEMTEERKALVRKVGVVLCLKPYQCTAVVRAAAGAVASRRSPLRTSAALQR